MVDGAGVRNVAFIPFCFSPFFKGMYNKPLVHYGNYLMMMFFRMEVSILIRKP